MKKITWAEERQTRYQPTKKTYFIERTWTKTDFYCMACKKRPVYEEDESEADYGGGNRHVCATCGFVFYGYESGYCADDKTKIAEGLSK